MLVLASVTAASIAGFMLVFWLTGSVATARQALSTARAAVATMRDPEAGDLERERAARAAALRLLAGAARLSLDALLALLAALAPVLLADWTGLASRGATFAFMQRPEVVAAGAAAVTLAWLGLRAGGR